MAMNVLIYLIIKKTGQLDKEGRELSIIFDVKLTRAAADKVVSRNPGTEVVKMFADKEA